MVENTKLNRVKNGTRRLLQVGVRDWESLGTSPSRIQKEFDEPVAEVMDAEVEGEDAIHHSKRPRVAERVAFHVPPEVEPQNLDFDVNEFLRSCPNPVLIDQRTNLGCDSTNSTPTSGSGISKPRSVAHSGLTENERLS